MKSYGYARVSTKGQLDNGNSIEQQIEVLKEAGCTEIFYEQFTGAICDRPKLNELVESLVAGDTVVVAKLDRIARSVAGGIEIIDKIIAKGAKLHILNMGYFDNTPQGKLMRNVMLSFAEFEREMIKQRTQEGKAIARTKDGYKEGRPKKQVDKVEFSNFLQKQKEGFLKINDVLEHFKISQSTYYNLKKEWAL